MGIGMKPLGMPQGANPNDVMNSLGINPLGIHSLPTMGDKALLLITEKINEVFYFNLT